MDKDSYVEEMKLMEEIEVALDQMVEDIRHQARVADINPYLMKDSNGRYLLLDALLALYQWRHHRERT